MDFNTSFFGGYGTSDRDEAHTEDAAAAGGDAGYGFAQPEAYDRPDVDETDAGDAPANTDTGTDDSDDDASGEPGKRARKAAAKVPKVSEDAAKTILEILDLLDDDASVRTARAILGTNSPSKATLLALTSEIKGRGLPKLEPATAKRIVDAVEVLDTDTGVAVAKTITGSNSPNRATLLSALTETKTRNHAASMFQHAAKIGTWDADELMMNLALEFASDKEYAKSLFVVLDAAAPERGFGRSSGDARKDAKAIAEKWGNGVDLARFAALRF